MSTDIDIELYQKKQKQLIALAKIFRNETQGRARLVRHFWQDTWRKLEDKMGGDRRKTDAFWFSQDLYEILNDAANQLTDLIRRYGGDEDIDIPPRNENTRSD